MTRRNMLPVFKGEAVMGVPASSLRRKITFFLEL